MGATYALIICLAWILGLFSTALPGSTWVLLGLGIVATFGLHRVWRTPLSPQIWLVAGAIAVIAATYFHWRLPQPAPHDISQLLSSTDASVKVLVEGTVTSPPRLTRSHKAQFWLQAHAIAPIGDGKPVTGKVYTTVPQEAAPSIHPGQTIQVSGTLYLPPTAANPGGFNFQTYLHQEGSFAGLKGDQVTVKQDQTAWGGWPIQQRIVQAQQQGLGTPAGALVSAMVLGGRAVDLPYDVKDAFVRVGLAHALAASGFQTSLILGVVLALTRRTSERVQFVTGSLALAGFVGLAGAQPAVLRAALMGFGGLVALVLHRQIKPLGALLVTAVLLLLWNPLWIWDLGFQLSFLATLGLLVTVPPLSRRLDWLPPAIASIIAVPIAAYLWTLPLQLGAFGVLSPYSIPANIITTPFISLISLGGMVSAIAALLWPPAGSALAWGLSYPTHALIAIVQRFNQLPGTGLAIGTLPVLLILALYSLLSLCHWHRRWQKRWWVALTAGVMLVLVPVAIGATTTHLTILASTHEPVLVLRDRGRVLVLGGSDAQTTQVTLLPYLQKTGINQIDWAIAANARSTAQWSHLAQQLAVRYVVHPPTVQASLDVQGTPHPTNRTTPQHISLGLQHTIQVGTAQITLLSLEPAIAQLNLVNQTWLWLGPMDAAQQKSLVDTVHLPKAQVLWWAGQALQPELVQLIQPTVAIASSRRIDSDTTQALQRQSIAVYVTGQDGAIQWTPNHGFSTYTDSMDNT